MHLHAHTHHYSSICIVMCLHVRISFKCAVNNDGNVDDDDDDDDEDDDVDDCDAALPST